jgi:tagatose-6-phosphate ketose/aldose isomerase
VPDPAAAKYPVHSLLASEIAQQPDLWLTTLERVQAAPILRHFEGVPVILTGAGTSAYAGSAIAQAWPGSKAIATTDLLLQSAAEIEFAQPGFANGGLLISLARSGESPESAAVVARLQRLFPSVRHLVIVCNAHGRLASMPGVEVICLDPRTNDRSLAMTASFSNLALAGLCLLHHDVLVSEVPAICDQVRSRLLAMYSVTEQIAAYSVDRLVVLTSAMQSLGTEASLKVIELTAGRVMTLSETFLGFRHGPLSVLREDTPVLCFASSDPGKRTYEQDLVGDLKARGLGRIALIGDESASGWPCDWFVPAMAPGLPDSLRTPFEIPLAQLVAYHCSLRAKIDPDNPSPDGTVTRVVKPFLIHEEN